VLNDRKFAVYDHRNILIILFLIITIFNKTKRELIYLADDGLHSLVVDQTKERYFFWNTSSLKKFILINFYKSILDLKRLHALQDNRNYSPKGSLFFDFYSMQPVCEGSLVPCKALFVDQPSIVDNLNDEELEKLKTLLLKQKDLIILIHPKRDNLSLYQKLNFNLYKSKNIEVDLKNLQNKIKIITYCSTIILAAQKYRHEVRLLQPAGLSHDVTNYVDACVNSLRK